MGIVHSFKCKYRQQIVREKLRAIEYSSTMPIIEVLNAIKKIKVAWDSVSQTTIENCYRKAGFKKVTEIEVEEIQEIQDETTKIICKHVTI